MTDMEHLFISLFDICIYGPSDEVFCPIFNQAVHFLIFEFWELCVFWITVLYQICVFQVLFPSLCFRRIGVCNFNEVQVLFQRRQRHPTPVLSPGESHGWRSLVGCSPWGRKESDNWATSLSLFTFMPWWRKWQPTPVFLPGESQGWGSLVGCHLWCHTESDTTEET